MQNDYDAIIIGGGPAGATAAMTLRQAGRKVLVLEKEKFPRFHIGESLLPYNRPIFDELGVWDKIQAAGFMTKRGAQFWMGDGSMHTRLNFSRGSFTEFPEAIQVERSKFDDILLRHAEELGAEVREETLVTSHQVESERVTLRGNGGNGVSVQLLDRFDPLAENGGNGNGVTGTGSVGNGVRGSVGTGSVCNCLTDAFHSLKTANGVRETGSGCNWLTKS